jgi:hypothetical protein
VDLYQSVPKRERTVVFLRPFILFQSSGHAAARSRLFSSRSYSSPYPVKLRYFCGLRTFGRVLNQGVASIPDTADSAAAPILQPNLPRPQLRVFIPMYIVWYLDK